MRFSKYRGSKFYLWHLSIAFTFVLLPRLGPGQTKVERNNTGQAGLSREGHEWAEQTLRELQLEEKVGQMLQVRYFADYRSSDSYEYKYVRAELQRYHIGSVVFGMHFNGSGPIRSSPLEAARVANQLQRDSNLPLLLAADFERGVASRLNDVPAFPWPMAFDRGGQTGSFPLSEISNHDEPNESCQTNIRKRPICPRVPAMSSPIFNVAPGESMWSSKSTR